MLRHYYCSRCFSTYDFLNQHKDTLEPVGLRFFQANWDESVGETFQSEFGKLKYHVCQYKTYLYLDYNKSRLPLVIIIGIKEPTYSVEPMPLYKSRLGKYKHRNIYKNKEKLF